MKKFLAILLTMLLVITFVGCGGNDSSSTIDYNKIEYNKITLNSIYQVYKDNRYKAEQMYIGQYIEVSASVFGVYETHISLHEYQYHNGIKTGYDDAWCKIVNDSLKEVLLELKKDDIITVKGKITSLTSTGDFQVNIDTYLIEL